MERNDNTMVILGGVTNLPEYAQELIMVHPPLRFATMSGFAVVKTDQGIETPYIIVPINGLGHC
jgi:hypothetical protein